MDRSRRLVGVVGRAGTWEHRNYAGNEAGRACRPRAALLVVVPGRAA